MVEDLADRQQDRTTVVKGPPASRAFDADGKPTRAAEGFAQGKGLTVKTWKSARSTAASMWWPWSKKPRRTAYDVLLEALPALVAGIKFDKTMRWNTPMSLSPAPSAGCWHYSASTSIPFEYAGLPPSNTTRGLRFYEPRSIAG